MTLEIDAPDRLPPRRGVVAVVLRGEKFLVIERSQQVVAPGAYCFPGGGIEADETEEQALVREFREELGAAITPTRLIWRSETRWRVALAWWLGEVAADACLVPNPAEVATVHWLSREEMAAQALFLESNHAFLAAIADGTIQLGTPQR